MLLPCSVHIRFLSNFALSRSQVSALFLLLISFWKILDANHCDGSLEKKYVTIKGKSFDTVHYYIIQKVQRTLEFKSLILGIFLESLQRNPMRCKIVLYKEISVASAEYMTNLILGFSKKAELVMRRYKEPFLAHWRGIWGLYQHDYKMPLCLAPTTKH